MYSVTVVGPHGLTRASTFDTGYRESVRLACCELHEAMRGGLGRRAPKLTPSERPHPRPLALKLLDGSTEPDLGGDRLE
jgi:hypothetical protein